MSQLRIMGKSGHVCQATSSAPSASRIARAGSHRPFSTAVVADLASRLNANAGNGTFKVQVDWLELQPDAEEE